ncbi:hypothetical protein [Dasineura jujubifolia toursvirus 2a]|nr:hypothetical protein [Dasineura jujubifolia toursvirus 2a]
MTISIKHEAEVPFGALANGYNTNFEINSQQWDSVVSLLTNINGIQYEVLPPYVTSIAKLWEYLEKELMNKAIQVGIDIKAKTDPNFEGILLNSDGRPLLYISENHYLGADMYNKNGENIYGKWLTNYRNILMGYSPEVYYELYILNRFLSVAINYEPLDDYLALSRNGAGVRYLNNILRKKYQNIVDLPSPEIVESTRKITTNIISYKPEEIIIDVIKTRIRGVRTANLSAYKYKVFTKFVEGIFRKHGFTESKTKYTPAKFIREMDHKDLVYCREKVYSYFESHDMLKRITPDVYIPSIDYINQTEDLTFQGSENNPLPFNQAYAFVDSTTSKLSMKDTSTPLFIENKNFPSIYHYMIYKVGSLIEGFDPYAMISDGIKFYSANESQNHLNKNLETFKNHFTQSRIVPALYSKFTQNPYLKDIIKSTGNEQLMILDAEPGITTQVINTIRNDTPFEQVMTDRGDVIDYIDSDSYFSFVQSEMLYSFMDILNIATPGNYTDDNIRTIQREFYDNITGIVPHKNIYKDNINVNGENLLMLCKKMGINISKKSADFLKRIFVSRILSAEYVSKQLFNNTDILFATKFVLINAVHRLSLGEFNNNNGIIYNYLGKEKLAMARVINAIAQCMQYKILHTEHIDKAFEILTLRPRFKKFAPSPVNKQTGPTKSMNDAGVISRAAGVNGVTLDDVQNITYGETLDEMEEYPDDDVDQEEIEVEGYDETNEEQDNPEDYYNDLMFAPNIRINSNEMAGAILKNLRPSKAVLTYFNTVCQKLNTYGFKNNYRINLYQ